MVAVLLLPTENPGRIFEPGSVLLDFLLALKRANFCVCVNETNKTRYLDYPFLLGNSRKAHEIAIG